MSLMQTTSLVSNGKKFNTNRGGTEILYNLHPIVFSESYEKTRETIMFGAQTTKQFQLKYQDSMKGNPDQGDKPDAEIGQVSD